MHHVGNLEIFRDLNLSALGERRKIVFEKFHGTISRENPVSFPVELIQIHIRLGALNGKEGSPVKGPRPVAEKDEDLARLMDLARGLLSKSEFQLKMGEFFAGELEKGNEGTLRKMDGLLGMKGTHLGELAQAAQKIGPLLAGNYIIAFPGVEISETQEVLNEVTMGGVEGASREIAVLKAQDMNSKAFETGDDLIVFEHLDEQGLPSGIEAYSIKKT
jgi:hypothetical protein